MANNSSGLNNTTQTALAGSEIFQIFMYSVIFALGIVGNALVIYVTGYKMKTTVNSIWFLNLAIADFISILVLIFNIVTVYNKMIWHFGEFICKFVSLVAVLNMFASIFLLTAISLDRCLSTWWIVWAQNKRTLVKGRIICTLVWVSSIGCSMPFVIYRSVNKKQCSYKANPPILKPLFICRFIVGFLIPFLIIASSYIAIGVRAKRLRRGKRLKPFRVIMSVILAFFICWFPFQVHQLCTIIAVENNWSLVLINDVAPYITCLVYLNSCLNPILYVFMCEEFKKKLSQSLLLVLETAFAEEHLSLRFSRPSTCSRLSESQGLHQTNDVTISSSGSSQDNKTCF